MNIGGFCFQEQDHCAPKLTSSRHSLQVLLRAGFPLLSGLITEFIAYKTCNKTYSNIMLSSPLSILFYSNFFSIILFTKF